MALIPVILDSDVPYVLHRTRPVSLLSLPLGEGTVLDHLLHMLAGQDISLDQTMVMPHFTATEAYCRDFDDRERAVRVVAPEAMADTLGAACEITDTLLVVNPRLWPMAGYDSSIIARQFREYQGVTNVVHLDAEATRELIEHDSNGHVKRIRRYYNLMHWPEAARTAIAYSLVPVSAMKNVVFQSLAELRVQLTARGLLSRDLPLDSVAIDLGRQRGFLRLHETLLANMEGEKRRNGPEAPAPEVTIGPGCRVSPKADLIGPLVLHANVVIGEGAVVVGPSLIGRDSIIRDGATVIQSVLLPGTDVASDALIRHRVASGACHGMTAGHESLAEAATETYSEDVPDGDQDSAVPLHTASTSLATRHRRVHAIMKRIVDVTLSVVALVVLSPLMLFLAVLINLDSSGPVFFIHRRERRGGKDFPCLKFRTMAQGAHLQQRQLYAQSQVDGPQFKMHNDPRVTRLGRWLRATNLDELPQLINVLVGHMSLVGPRPSPFRENQICVPWRLARLSVRPGITGLWQVCRQDDRSRGDFHERIYYDIAYVRHFSIWLDFKIFVATIVTLGGRWSVPLSWLTRDSLTWRQPQIQASRL